MALEGPDMLDASVCPDLHMVLDLHKEYSPMLSFLLGQAGTSEPPLLGSGVDSTCIDDGSTNSILPPPERWVEEWHCGGIGGKH